MDNQSKKPTELSASAQTRKYLGGLGPFMVERAGVDYLLVVTDADYKSDYTGRNDLDTREGQAQMGAYGRQAIEQHLSPELRKEIAGLSPEERDLLYAFPVSHEIKMEHTYAGKLVAGSPANAAAMRLPSGKTIGIVDAGRAEINKYFTPSYKSAESKLPSGEYTDGAAFALLHEVGHIRQRTSGMLPMPDLADNLDDQVKIEPPTIAQKRDMELYAERDGVNLYRDAHAAGLVRDANVPKTVMNERLRDMADSYLNGEKLRDHDIAGQMLLSANNAPSVGANPEHDDHFQRFMGTLVDKTADTFLDDKNHIKPNVTTPHARFCSYFAKPVEKDGRKETLREAFGKCVLGIIQPETVAPVMKNMPDDPLNKPYLEMAEEQQRIANAKKPATTAALQPSPP